MGDKTFCHEAGSSRSVRADKVEGFIRTLVCNVSSRHLGPCELVAGRIFLSPFHQNRVTHTAAVKKTQIVINKHNHGCVAWLGGELIHYLCCCLDLVQTKTLFHYFFPTFSPQQLNSHGQICSSFTHTTQLAQLERDFGITLGFRME